MGAEQADLFLLAQAGSWISRGTSTLVIVLLGFGLWKRRHPRIHIPVMLGCFAIDVANVTYIELSRLLGEDEGAVAKSMTSLSGGGFELLDLHVLASMISILGYVVAAVTGTVLFRRGAGRVFHRTNAGVFIVARLVNYVTSFLV